MRCTGMLLIDAGNKYARRDQLTNHSVKLKDLRKEYETYNAVEVVDKTIQKVLGGDLTF
jgi:hypothetical protein